MSDAHRRSKKQSGDGKRRGQLTSIGRDWQHRLGKSFRSPADVKHGCCHKIDRRQNGGGCAPEPTWLPESSVKGEQTVSEPVQGNWEAASKNVQRRRKIARPGTQS